MTAEVLGGAVQHDVRAEINRAEEIRRQERIVDHHLRSRFMGLADHRGRVDDVQRRIGQWFEVNHVGRSLQGRIELPGVPHVDDLGIESQPGQFLDHEVPCPGIHRVMTYDPGSSAYESHHGLGDRGHAAGGRDASSSALEGAHLLFKGGERGIATSQVGAVHRGRLVDRRRRRVLRFTRVNAARYEPVILIHAFVLSRRLAG